MPWPDRRRSLLLGGERSGDAAEPTATASRTSRSLAFGRALVATSATHERLRRELVAGALTVNGRARAEECAPGVGEEIDRTERLQRAGRRLNGKGHGPVETMQFTGTGSEALGSSEIEGPVTTFSVRHPYAYLCDQFGVCIEDTDTRPK